MANKQAKEPGRFSQWLESFKASAPSQRDVYSAYARLENIEGGDIGTYVQGLYQLAKAPGGLKIQKFQQAFIERKTQANAKYKFDSKHLKNHKDPILKELVEAFYPEKAGADLKHTLMRLHAKLYHPATTAKGKDRAKTPFELAILKTINRNQIHKILLAEFSWQQEQGLFPQEVYRLRLDEWLDRLKEAGYRIKKDGVKEIKVTLDNDKPKAAEGALHYLMEWVATIATTSAIILAVSAITANPLLAIAAGIANYVALECANAFDTFDYGEWFWKDGRWSATRNFANPSAIDPLKLFNTAFVLSCIGYVASLGASSLFSSTFAFPMISQLGAAAVVSIASTVAAWSFATTVIGLSIPRRFLKGLGIHNNQINPDEMPRNMPTYQFVDKTNAQIKYDMARQALAKHKGSPISFNPLNPMVVSAKENADNVDAKGETPKPKRRKAAL